MKHGDTLDILTSELFDYAGMFPPAALPFHKAVQESVSLRSSLERPWLLNNDLVLDVRSAHALSLKAPSGWGYSRPPTLCILASETAQAVLSVCEELQKKRTDVPVRFTVASIEARCSASSMVGIIEDLGEYCRTHRITLALEPNLSIASWASELAQCVKLLATYNSKIAPLALKVRCSGDTAITPEKLAYIIEAVTSSTMHLKATGGLHHPIIEHERYRNTFGFLNVAAAVMFRRALGPSFNVDECIRLLCNDSFKEFSFGEKLRFRHFEISHVDLLKAKNAAIFSIGSCSLKEPDDDIARLQQTT